ncbi:hypothetical protein GWK47_019321 [Chionoecetes opilio]|uniref:Uncharacterized protein n=1 Tax=Chionoecetes opilio TaxID=41210 RepID=A0A8J4XUJ3_CHIOP|nr:hypothetical protein GWK47_019321 [Chionoecetes opilio]
MDRLIALPHSLNMLQRVADLITTPPLTDLMENGMQVSDVIKSPSALALKLTSEHELDLEVVEAFLDSRINISRVLSLAGVRGPKEVVCSPEYLAEFLVTNNSHLVPDISRAFCHLPLSQAANVTAIFLSSLDPQKLIQKVCKGRIWVDMWIWIEKG